LFTLLWENDACTREFNMRIEHAGALVLVFLALTGVASAQTTTATTGTTGTSSATTTTTVNAYTGTGNGANGNGAGGLNGGNGSAGTTNLRYSGHEYSTPSVQGSYFAGANPCLIGVGASGAGGPIGLSFTFGRNDPGCQRRSDAAAWHALGHDDVAIARMCQDDDNHAAFEALGYLCPQSRPKVATVALVTPVSPQPATAGAMTYPQPVSPNPSIAAQPSPNTVATRIPESIDRPDWCTTVTGPTEQARFKKACSF